MFFFPLPFFLIAVLLFFSLYFPPLLSFLFLSLFLFFFMLSFLFSFSFLFFFSFCTIFTFPFIFYHFFFLYFVFFFSFSIIHPRCIKEVFSDATVFITDFGLFLHHIGSDRNPGMTLEKPSRLLDRDVLRSCLYQSKENFYNARLRLFL